MYLLDTYNYTNHSCCSTLNGAGWLPDLSQLKPCDALASGAMVTLRICSTHLEAQLATAI